MKAMYINAPGQVEIKDVEMPVRKEGEVLLKLLYGGICGSDPVSYTHLDVYKRQPPDMVSLRGNWAPGFLR